MTSIDRPRRESDGQPSAKNQAIAARIRVKVDRRRGVETPEWIVKLSETPAAK